MDGYGTYTYANGRSYMGEYKKGLCHGYGTGYSVKQVIDKANEITNGSIEYNYTARRNGDAENLVANIEKIHRAINWKPKYNDLSIIIKSAINWEKKLSEKNI